MIKWLMIILFGDSCKHKWVEIGTSVITDFGVRHTYKCTECGRFKRVRC